ncbi:hypothetical protein niasHT_000118 [Heterodera trifolii]|uniref:GPI alpha-1,4-mannosyltransferase I, catalytic subunit n=1 Tax=Heterodera trifolii TaxID=157864 RepID=A0ABD2LSH7_9BILA
MPAAVKGPWTLKTLFLAPFLLRLLLIFYARIHDYYFEVNFTDIDYEVFTEAALLVREEHSPYEQSEYRYTPLIAWLLVPNGQYADFGKVLFCAIDVLVAFLHLLILETRQQNRRKSSSQNEGKTTHPSPVFVRHFGVLFWLFNPFTAIISARGNCDAIICALVLLSLFLLVRVGQRKNDGTVAAIRRLALAAVVHGAGATHFRIFPLIYLPSIFLSIAHSSKIHQHRLRTKFIVFKSFVWMCLTNFRGFAFILLSLASFALSVAFCFALYGHAFLNAAFLYHLSRVDIRHNFSPYFLPLYLARDSSLLTQMIGLIAFVPQIVCICLFALWYSDDLPFCWFLTTFAFVSFNKVSTSQYFVWYLCFVPLLFTRLKFSWQMWLKMFALWLFGQAFWLLPAYLYEFRGWATLSWVWFASLTFLGINSFLIVQFVRNYSAEEQRMVEVEREVEKSE